MTDNFGKTAGIGNYHGNPSGETFQGDNAKRFVKTGKNGTIGHGLEAIEVFIGHKARKITMMPDTEMPGLLFEFVGIAATDNNKFSFSLGLSEDFWGSVE